MMGLLLGRSLEDHLLPSWFSSRRLLPCLTVIFLLIILPSFPPPANAQSRNNRMNTKNLASCWSDSDCDSSKTFLRCHNRVCQCSTIHHFDEEINRCLIRVGGSCTVGSREQFCVAYATCHQRSKTIASGECRCRSRYWENIENLCVSGAALNIPYYHRYFLSALSVATVLIASFRFSSL